MPLTTPLREHIVCVDDEEGILAALRQQLSARFGDECDIAVAKNAREALDLIDDLQQDGEQVAVVIADQIMPGMKGVELLEEVHRRSPQTVKILLTGQAGLDAVVYAINRAGLDQYIPKPWDEPDLRLTIQNLLSRFRLERERAELLSELRSKNAELATLNSSLEEKVVERTRELEALNARLAELAITDGLTGLYNHRHFRERLSLEMERSNRTGLPLSVLMIDVDHFKGYNDRHGHLAGDNALRGVSKILQHGRRANDVVARYGGEEFAIILLDVGKSAAKEVAERICAQVAEFPFEFGSTQPAGQADDLARRRVVPRRRRRARAGAGRGRPRAVRRQERRPQPSSRRRGLVLPSEGTDLKLAVLGGGAWGGVLAAVASRHGHDVALWEVDAAAAAALAERRASDRSVPGFRLPGRGRGRHRRRGGGGGSRHAGGRDPVGVRRAHARGRARGGRAGACRRVRVERPRARDRRHDGRGDRRRHAGRARRRAVRPQLRAGDRERPSRRAGGGVRPTRRCAAGSVQALLRRRIACASTRATTSQACASAARSRTSSRSPSAAATGSASATTRAPR